MKEGWEVKRLGEVCEITMGQSPSSESYNDIGRGMPFFQGCSDFGKLYPHVTTYCDMPKKMADINDVLISVRAPIGTLNIANLHCCIGRGLASVREIKGLSCYKYLYFFLLKSKEELQEKGTGATFKAIGKDTLLNFPILVPSIEEQSRIVEELDLLSNIIEKKRQQLSELDNLAQSIFYDMFGDPVTNEKGWEVKKLGEVCDVRDGTHDSPKYLEHSDYVLITSKNIVNGDIDYTSINYICEEDYNNINKRSFVEDGDIIMAMIGTIGKPIIVKRKGVNFCIKNVALIKFGKSVEVINTYIQYLLDNTSYKQYIDKQNKGGTQKFIALGAIRKLDIPLPPLNLQQLFAKKIEAIEKQKALIKQSIAETEELFNSRMDYYFS